MIRTRLIGLFGGLVLTSAMAACGSEDDSTESNAGSAGISGHAGTASGGRGGRGGASGNSGTGGGSAAGRGGSSFGGMEQMGGNAGSEDLGGASGMGGEAGGGEPVVTPTKFKIRAENVSAQSALPTAISPGLAVLHTNSDPFFTKDAVDRNLGLAALAAEANPTTLFNSLQGAAGIDLATVFNKPTGATAVAAIQPGEAYEFLIDAVPGDKLSLVSMFGESNDVFIAPTNGGGIALFDNNKSPLAARDVTGQLSLWDAGVEKDEAPGLGPTQKPRQIAGATGSAEGVASKRLDTTRALPIAQGIVTFAVTEAAGVYTIKATNASAQMGALYTPLSPFYVATHAASFKLFTPGTAASAGLQSLAEDGSPTALVAATIAATGVGTATAQGTGNLAPGDVLTFVVTPTTTAPRLSLATMITQTNDVFVATPSEGIALLDSAGLARPAIAVQDELNRLVANWDAGTEANQVPGAGADIAENQATANQGAADSVATVHRYADSTNDFATLTGIASVVITQAGGGDFTVTVSNVSDGAFVGAISPVVWAVHDAQTHLFQLGQPVSAGLQSLAEDGVGATLATELGANSTHVSSKGVAGGTTPIASGANYTFTVTPDTTHPRLSLAAMIAPSNDTFLALGDSGVALLESNGTPRSDTAIATDVAAALAAFDAGTEANQAGAAGPSMAGKTLQGTVSLQAAPNTGAADGNGLVRLLATNPVWTYPSLGSVIKVTVTPQ